MSPIRSVPYFHLFSSSRLQLAFSVLTILFVICLPRGMSMPANPLPFTEKQPDGTEIELRLRGNEHFHWLEHDGYTVLREESGWYVYAERSPDGKLARSRHRVGSANPTNLGLPKRLLPEPEVIRETMEKTLPMPVDAAADDAPRPINPVGNVKNVVILMRFADHTGRTLPSDTDFDTIFNEVGGDPTLAPSGSVRDVYYENSYGALVLDSTVFGWVTLPQTEAYYADGQSGLVSTVREAIQDALALADPLINFSQFDDDNDGFVDAISFVHSGYAAEFGGTDAYGAPHTDRIWSHRWTIPTWTSSEGVKVRDYHINPGVWSTSGTAPGRIGVICHETGHFFGLPDLYDTSGAGSGIGSFGMMANSWGFDGSQRYPPHFSAWSKIQLGWISPTPISSFGTYPVPEAQSPGAVIYRIDEGYPSGEYLLIENRQPVGYDQKIPAGTGGAGGLAIWHIDENKPANNDPGFPGQSGWPTNNRHYKVALLQADGEYGLERGFNRGDNGDLYRGGFVDTVNAGTVPSSDSYQNGVALPTGNTISEISNTGSTMTFRYFQGPAIRSPLDVSAFIGKPFTYQIDAVPTPSSYTCGSLPSGLGFNSSTGVISGVPTAAPGNYPVTIGVSDGVSGDSRTLNLNLRNATPLPFMEDFESGVFSADWEVGGTGNHRTQITTQYTPHGGQRHVVMDSSVDSVYSRNQMTVFLDLDLRQGVELRFWAKELNDEDHAPPSNPFTGDADFDGVAISEDGNTWYEVAALRSDGSPAINSVWQEYVVDLDQAINTFGISYNSEFAIRFNHFDNFTAPTDGIAIDDISVTAVSSPSTIFMTSDSVNDTGVSISDRITSNTRPRFYGQSPANATIQIYSNQVPGTVGTTTADANGDWSFTPASPLPNGTHELTSRANGGSSSPAITVVIDTISPASPSALGLSPFSDTGISNSDQITFDSLPIIVGTTEALATVELYQNGQLIQTGSAGSGGSFSLPTTISTEGVHQFSARATDRAGNQSSTSTPVAITFDFTPPTAPSPPDLLASSDFGDADDDNLTNTSRPTFSGTGEDGSLVNLYSNGELVGSATVSGGTWVITSDFLRDGQQVITARQFDIAGNDAVAAAGLTIEIDTDPPGRPSNFRLDPDDDRGFSNSDGLTSQATPTFLGDAAPGSQLRVFRSGTIEIARVASGPAFEATVAPLAPGAHSITARCYDAAGNQSRTTPAIPIEIDTSAPLGVLNPDLAGASDTGVSDTDNITRDNTPEIRGLSLFVQGGTRVHFYVEEIEIFEQDVSGNWSIVLPELADGDQQLEIRNEDAAGNLSTPAFLPITIDTTPPPAPFDIGLTPETDTGTSNSDGITRNTSPVVTGSSEPGEVQLFQDGNPIGTVLSDGTWTLTTSNLPEGSTVFTASQSDLAGNDGNLSSPFEVTIDVTAPSEPTMPAFAPGEDTGSDNSDGLTNRRTPTFTGDAEAGTLVILFDGEGNAIGQGVANSPWSITTDPLPDGPNSVTASASDPAGNLSPITAAMDFEIDSTPPTVTVEQAPAQADPTIDEPIEFVVTFSEPVTGFDAGDVTLGGAVGGIASVIDGVTPGVDFLLRVSGTSGEGTLTASVNPNAAADAAGNFSLASTSSDNSVEKRQVPGPVAGVTATDGDFPDKVTVNWVDSGASTYRIFRHPFQNPSAASEIGSVGAGITAFDDGAATPDLPYFYWVRAEDADGVGDFGAPDSGFASSGEELKKATTPISEAPAPDADPVLVWTNDAVGLYDGLLRDAGDNYTIVGGVSRLFVSQPRPGSFGGGFLSASLFFQNQRAVIRGSFNGSGHLQGDFRQANGSILTADLQVFRTVTPGRESETLRGTITWQGTTAVVDLPRAPFHPRLNPTPEGWTGSFTMIVPSLPGADNTLQPGGDGWATVNLNAGGKARVAGVLGDGTRFTESACLSSEGDFSLYTWLYRPIEGERGSLGVRLVFRDHAPDISDFDGVAQWNKPADAREKRYPNGFQVEAWTLGCRYDRPGRGERALATLEDQYHNACLALEGGGGPEGGGLERSVTWMTNNRIVYYGPERASALVRTANGSLVGSWFDPETRSRWPFAGVVFQAQQIVAGHFLAADTTGSLAIKPSVDTPYPGSENPGGTARPTVPDPPAPGPDLTNLPWDSSAAGSYGGVTLMAEPTGGLLNLRVTRTGVISGVFEIDGERRSFRGGFDANGTANFPVIRRGTTDGTLSLQLARATAIPDDSFQVAGTITLDGVIHQLDAQRRPGFHRTDRCPQEGVYNLAMRAPDGADPAVEPAGDGCGSLRVNFLGNASGLFFLADGSRTSMSGHVSRSGEWATYRPLFGGRGRGFLAGTLTFRGAPADPGQVDGEWRWKKAAGVAPTTYPGGIATTRGVVGNAWTPPARGDRALPGLADDDFNAWARFLGPALGASPAVDFAVSWADNNRVTYHGPERLVLSVNARTGRVNGRMIDRAKGINFRFQGIVLPNQGLVTGAYTADGESGLFSMEAR